MLFSVRALTYSTFLIATGCGYLGLELNSETIDPPGHGDGDDDGGGQGGRHGEGGRNGDGDGDDSDESSSGVGEGGARASGGSTGSGATDGSGGANSLDECSISCVWPVLLHRTFEAGLPSAPAQIKEDPDAFVGTTDQLFRSGSFSLVTTQGETETDAEITDFINPMMLGHLYYRAWIYLPEGAVNDWIKVIAFNGATEGTDVNLLSNGAVEIYSHIASTSSKSGSGQVPTGEWFCLQTHVFIDNFEGRVEVLVNEESVLEVSAWDTRPGPGVNNLVYGIAETGPKQSGATIYTDDVVASAEPVPCGPF